MKTKYKDMYLIWCEDCRDFFIGRNFVHFMYYCPYCNKNAVDIEDFYIRKIGNVRIVKEVKLNEKDKEKIR